MSALDELKKKNPIDMTMLEFVVTQAEYSEITGNAEHAAADLAALNARVEELERVRKIASEIFVVVSTGRVVRTAQACKHGNYATAPYNHAWWCDECLWELEAALKGAE